ncbi:Importin-4 [Myotis davidii]|uniref:Importin-4 n=1 Tax=Myotis davidii TaxID=225400 RepID=L5LK30_MYODS|nr:Importin-4 [Myotis davidii]
MGEGLAPYLPEIPTLMLLSCVPEGLVPQNDSSGSFLPFDDESDGEEVEEGNTEISGCSVENAFDEKGDTCVVLGEISVNVRVALLPYMESVFEEVFKVLECLHLNV